MTWICAAKDNTFSLLLLKPPPPQYTPPLPPPIPTAVSFIQISCVYVLLFVVLLDPQKTDVGGRAYLIIMV